MIPQRSQMVTALQRHIPPTAVAYALSLWDRHPFVFRLSQQRTSKLGDYRFEPRQRWHIISVNRTLSPRAFLLTYVHEVAHLFTFEEFQGRVQPHGIEWKSNFQKLMAPLLQEEVYPEPILGVLQRHMQNPKASSVADSRLTQLLHPELHAVADGEVPLNSLSIGSWFRFRKKRYQVVAHRRTRTLVAEEKSNRRYLITQTAPVLPE